MTLNIPEDLGAGAGGPLEHGSPVVYLMGGLSQAMRRRSGTFGPSTRTSRVLEVSVGKSCNERAGQRPSPVEVEGQPSVGHAAPRR